MNCVIIVASTYLMLVFFHHYNSKQPAVSVSRYLGVHLFNNFWNKNVVVYMKFNKWRSLSLNCRLSIILMFRKNLPLALRFSSLLSSNTSTVPLNLSDLRTFILPSLDGHLGPYPLHILLESTVPCWDIKAFSHLR